ncbi:LPXTG cell wall anchor domain-containing protein [Streptomyces cinnamoneus]|nr:LPXTG cell wall anchor domain-containing protein [Streptomyces cinnamoneus]
MPETPALALAGATVGIAGGLIWYRRRANAAKR